MTDHVASHDVHWRYTAPDNCSAKMLLLTIGRVAVVGNWSGKVGEYYVAWTPLPKRDKQFEEVMGL